MNIRKICYLTLLFLILCNCCVYSEQKEIICNTSFARNTLTVAGRLTGVTQEQEVVLLVGDWDNIVHIEQVTSDANGNFSFQFDVSETLPSGYYEFQIGTDAGHATYHGFFCYAVAFREPVLESDIAVSMSSGVPTLSGTVRCADEKTLTFNILNKTDNKIIAEETVTAVDGTAEFKYALPNLRESKEYDFVVSYTDGNNSVISVDIDISSTTWYLNFKGTVETADNVDVDVQFRSANTTLLDKDLNIKGEYRINKTIPNISSNSSLYITAKAYESTIEEIERLHIGDIASIGISAQNITDIDDAVYNVSFNADQLELVDVIGYTYEQEIVEGVYGDITILSVTDGSVCFKLNLQDSDYGLNGIVNLIKFKVKTEDAIKVKVDYQ